MKVCIMGLGAFGGGQGAARYFAELGHDVVVSDMKEAAELVGPVQGLRGHSNIRFSLGRHAPEDVCESDLLVVNPAIPDNQELFAQVRAQGSPWTTEAQIFLEKTKSQVVAITGTLGKTTTAVLTGDILRAHHSGRVLVGGNIGGSLLNTVSELTADDIVVCELSSFQLGRIDVDRLMSLNSDSIVAGCLTNLSADHDSRHGGFDGYVQAKLRLLSLLAPRAPLITGQPLPQAAFDAITRLGNHWLPTTAADLSETDREALSLRGACAEENAVMALALATSAIGPLDDQLKNRALHHRVGLEHRLEDIGSVNGIAFFNDSKSTTPEATAAAVRTLTDEGQCVHAIVGGASKGIGAAAIMGVATLCKSITCIGTDARSLHDRVSGTGTTASWHTSLADAVTSVISRAKTGETILFSPGHASYDAFSDYRARGRAFKNLILGQSCSQQHLKTGVLPDPDPSFCSDDKECYHQEL